MFKGVLREKFTLENAEEDLDEYYEKTTKSTPGLDRGNKIFSSRNNAWQCLECGKKFASAASAERAANSDAGCPGCGGTDIDDVPENQNSVTGTQVEVHKGRPIFKDENSNRYFIHYAGEYGWANDLPGIRALSREWDEKGIKGNPELRQSEKSYMPNGCSGPNGCSAKKMKNSPETTDGAATITKGSGPIKSVESTPGNQNLVGYVESKKNDNDDPLRSEVGFENCAGACGCSEESHRPEALEPCKCSCPECAAKKKEYSLDNGLATPSNKKCPTCDGPVTPTEGVSGSNHQYTCKRCAQDFDETELVNGMIYCKCNKCGASLEEGTKCKKCGYLNSDDKVEYPHDVFENKKDGLKKGSSKYGSLKNEEADNGGPGSGPRPGHGKGDSGEDALGFKKGEGPSTSPDSEESSGWRTVARQKSVSDHPKVKELADKEDKIYGDLQKEMRRVYDAVGDEKASQEQDRDPKIAAVRKQLREVMDQHNKAIDEAYEESKKKQQGGVKNEQRSRSERDGGGGSD